MNTSETSSTSLPAKGDVLVIGAGVVGVCVAHYLLEAGYRPLIVDKGDIAAGASYANAGLIVPSSWQPLAKPGVEASLPEWVTRPHGPVYAPIAAMLRACSWWDSFLQASEPHNYKQIVQVLQQLVYTSVDLYQQLNDELGLDCEFRAQGTLSLFLSSEALRLGAKQALAHRGAGGAAAVLDKRAVRDLVPQATPQVVGGVLYPEDGQVSPGAFVKSMAQSIAKRGAEFRLQTEVLGFETEGNRITGLVTTQGSVACEQVVLATGAWSGRLGKALGIRIPVEPAKGYSYTFPRPPGFPDLGLSLTELQTALNPLAKTVRVAGTLEFSGFDDRLHLHRARLLNSATKEYLGLESSPTAVEIWRGWRPMTPDGAPIIQWSSRYANLLLATGHNKIGMTLGPVTGKLVAQVLQGQATGFKDGAFRLDRFRVSSRSRGTAGLAQTLSKAVLNLFSVNIGR